MSRFRVNPEARLDLFVVLQLPKGSGSSSSIRLWDVHKLNLCYISGNYHQGFVMVITRTESRYLRLVYTVIPSRQGLPRKTSRAFVLHDQYRSKALSHSREINFGLLGPEPLLHCWKPSP